MKKLVADLLGIPLQSNGQRVDLKVQVCNEGDYPERVMYYWAREFSSALMAGQGYSTLPRTIVISIIDFILFECEGASCLPLLKTFHLKNPSLAKPNSTQNACFSKFSTTPHPVMAMLSVTVFRKFTI